MLLHGGYRCNVAVSGMWHNAEQYDHENMCNQKNTSLFGFENFWSGLY